MCFFVGIIVNVLDLLFGLVAVLGLSFDTIGGRGTEEHGVRVG